MRALNQSVLLAGFFLPAAISLYFAWSIWIVEDRQAIPPWRRAAFQCGLVSAVFAMALFVPSCWYMLGTRDTVRGVELAANWASVGLWFIGLATAFAGQKWARASLALWGVLMVLGLVGIVSARILY